MDSKTFESYRVNEPSVLKPMLYILCCSVGLMLFLEAKRDSGKLHCPATALIDVFVSGTYVTQNLN